MSERTRILVTGGAKGVGAAVVRAMAAQGHDVVFTYRSSAAEARARAEEIAAAHPGATVEPRALDLADRAAVEAFCGTIENERYLGFVHNAGRSYDALCAMLAQDEAEAAMQVNFFAFTRLCKALMRPMLRARAGRIVAIGSVAALQANAGNAAYAATKGALAAYARTLAMETAKRGVTVNVVAPGFVDTDMLAPYAGHRERMEAQIPAGRFCRPEEVAGLAAFLMTPPAAYITGATLPIDGGLTAMLGVHR